MDALKKTVKSVLGRMTYGASLHRPVLQNSAAIVAFHRITDAAEGRALNCTPEVFEELCEFFKKHFDVVPLGTLLDRIRRREAIGGALAITFDDGYKDNHDVAAPILAKLGLPATFFVATSFIGSTKVPAWDARDGFPSRWMGWDDVVDLDAQGFDIGGHTENHVDLGTIDIATAREEITACRAVLEEKLRKRVTHFAYPFGGVRNIRPETQALVAEAGFECCLSCHGGVVRLGDDAYSLRREPLNTWMTSAYQYGFELLQRARSRGPG